MELLDKDSTPQQGSQYISVENLKMYSIFLELLKLTGESVADVSRATGISETTLSNWKVRNSTLSLKNAVLLANHFNVSVPYLMGQEELQNRTRTDPFDRQLLRAFRSLNMDGKQKVIEYADMISRMAEFQKGETSSDSKDGVKNA